MTVALQRSPWLAQLAERHPDWFSDAALACDDLRWPSGVSADEADAMAFLRREVLRERARIAVRDLDGRAPLAETLSGLSRLADRACQLALDVAMVAAIRQYGQPRNATGQPVQPVVLGMGKLGGGELNFSSDIDLIFTFTEAGETDGPRGLDNAAFFAKVVQGFTRLLAERTADGFVYRVDWMLRPFGSAGAPAASFSAMEDYYQVHGREWERYALIKARPVAGDIAAGHRLLDALRPFVYRRYLDFDAVHSLRELKRMIEEEVARKGLEDNVKLGAGGIREVEFIVQSFQLIRGGQDGRLRSPQLRPTLAYLGQAGMLSPEVAQQLDTDYAFLRRLENAIQMQADEQTHRFPEATAVQSRIAVALGLPDAEALVAASQAVRSRVRSRFNAVFQEDAAADTPVARLVSLLWEGRIEVADVAEGLHAEGLTPAEPLAQALRGLAADRHLRMLRERTVERLRDLLGLLLQEALAMSEPGIAARRALEIVAAITGRATYISLLRDSATARAQLLKLCAASPWLSDYMARSPALLDQLLDPRALYAPPGREAMADELAGRLAHLAPEDPEAFMNTLRRFQKEMTLRVAAADLVEALPLVQVSDRLTWLAEVLVEAALTQTLADMRKEYGTPRRSDGSEAGLGVIAYGKLGGIEMGYGSDLDLVFVHDADDPQADTEGGARTLDTATWFARCAQRLISALSAQTAAGRVYEIDLQLRPSGNSGLVVTSFRAFDRYQREQAWTWEHQALTRARYLCGPAMLGAAFEASRRAVLERRREPQALAAEIRDMRQKMRASLDKSDAETWDLKQGLGGLTDAEFITQYLVLREACRAPEVLRWSDNWRQLDVLAGLGVIAPADKDALIEAYRALRLAAHRRALQNQDSRVPAAEFAGPQAVIAGLWQRLLAVDSAPGPAQAL